MLTPRWTDLPRDEQFTIPSLLGLAQVSVTRVLDDQEVATMVSVMLFDKLRDSTVKLVLGTLGVVQYYDLRIVAEPTAE